MLGRGLLESQAGPRDLGETKARRTATCGRRLPQRSVSFSAVLHARTHARTQTHADDTAERSEVGIWRGTAWHSIPHGSRQR